MNPEVLDKVKSSLEKISQRPIAGSKALLGKVGVSIPLDKTHFNAIHPHCSSMTVFVDGGSAVLLESPHVVLGIIRVYATTYKDNKRISTAHEDMYVLVDAKDGGEGVTYVARALSGHASDWNIELSVDDVTIRRGVAQVDITSMIDVMRRFAELKFATAMIPQLTKGDVLILDGSLQSVMTGERALLDDLSRSSEDAGVHICALSKKTALLTDRGAGMEGALGSFGPPGEWYYYPLVEPASKLDVCFVKLHHHAKHVFRFDFLDHSFPLDLVLSNLAANASDPIFFGYPYGLIDVDRFARISNEEKMYLRTKVAMYLGKTWESMSVDDAHAILDNIR